MFLETLELLERGELVRDYNANMPGGDSEDEDDPRTLMSVSSQESKLGPNFVDIDAFTVIPDCDLPEFNMQVNQKLILSCIYMGNLLKQFAVVEE
jgi:hypothetical protein